MGDPLTKNYGSLDNNKILQSLTTLPTYIDLNPHDFNHSNETEKKKITSHPPPQVSNHNPSTANDTDITNITPKSSSPPISTT